MDSPTCTAVLVVEGEADIRKDVAESLRAEGFQVYEAESEQQALAVMERMPKPALILADLMTSALRGPSLVEALRVGDRIATLPVVVLSAEGVGAPEGHRRLKKLIDLKDLVHIVGRLCLRRM